MLGTFDGSENDDNGDSDSDTNGLASLHADAAAEIFVGLSSGDERRAHDRSTGSTTPAFAAAETAAGPTSEMQGRLPVARARYAAEVKMSAEDAESIRAAMSGLDLPAPEWAKELDVCTLQQALHTHTRTRKHTNAFWCLQCTNTNVQDAVLTPHALLILMQNATLLQHVGSLLDQFQH